jgi:predicted nucleotidyltransferase
MTDGSESPLEDRLTEARQGNEVTDEEIAEARKRRSAIASALLREFLGSRVYSNGSVAHGDALTPLTDIDLGVVVAEAKDTHGPAKKGPGDLKQRAADAIRHELKADYGDLHVEVEGRKRSILVRFNDPVSPRFKDFTADVIVAIDHPSGVGLLIPRYDTWDRSHPERHTAMVLAAIKATVVAFAHVVRLLKHWNRQNGKPLCSWNIKALALGCITKPTTQLAGLQRWFTYAADQLEKGETPDPAGVAPKPIKLNKPRMEVVRTLRDAAKRVSEAIALEQAGYPLLAWDEIAKLFNDEAMLPRPNQAAVRAEEARRLREKAGGIGVITTGTGLGAHRPRVPAKSWAP